ncbi:MAG: hypothetical protein NT069_27220, partial [Planctomycetota bacterium]|nr:hypothetical protein [Planctomycetota bacterium]
VAFSVVDNGIQWEIADWQDPRSAPSIPTPAAAVAPAALESPTTPDVPTLLATPPVAASESTSPPAPPSSQQTQRQQTPRRNPPAIPKRNQPPQRNPLREPVTWSEAKTQRERESEVSPVLESTAPRPAVDGSPPIWRTEEELRPTPEWKRASRSERKRLLRNAKAGVEPD